MTMYKKYLIIAVAISAALASPNTALAAHSWRDFKDVTNTSFVEPDGDRSLQLSVDVPAPVNAVYDAMTTSAGFASWAVPVAKIDLRVGGMIEASYDANSKFGDPNNIKNQIIAYIPNRLLVIHNVQTPAGFVDSALFQKTVTIMEFTAVDANTTHVTLTNAGYGPGKGFDDVYSHFEWGDAYTLHELRARFVKGPVDWAAMAAQEKAQAATHAVEGKK
jgi:uncharacterized protein YndB with AHSA1/START domain